MTATNHALTGALIGLTIANPLIALPLAFVSHFMLDATPHYDLPGDEPTRLQAHRFRYHLAVDTSLCVLLVVALAWTQPKHWLVAAVAAFLATSPNLFWLPKFLRIQRTGKVLPTKNWFLRFHSWIQWKTGPKLWWVEAAWYGIFGGFLITRL